MTITKEKKQGQIQALADLLTQQKAIIFVDIKGLDSQSFLDFRKKIRNEAGAVKVIKKTLAVRAFQERGYPIAKSNLIGQTALIFALDDSNKSLKASYNFAQNNERFKIITGFVDNRLIEREQLAALITSPPKEILLQQVVGNIKNPLSQLVFTLNQTMGKFIMVLQGVQNAKGKNQNFAF